MRNGSERKSTHLCERDLRAALTLVERVSDAPDVSSCRREVRLGLREAIGCDVAGIDELEGRFGERERELLELLRPHLETALSVASLRERAAASAPPPPPSSWPAANNGSAAARGLDRGRLAGRGLTERELDVLELAGEGLINAAIGLELGIRPRTVQKHLERVHAKLGVGTRLAAIARARELSGAAV